MSITHIPFALYNPLIEIRERAVASLISKLKTGLICCDDIATFPDANTSSVPNCQDTLDNHKSQTIKLEKGCIIRALLEWFNWEGDPLSRKSAKSVVELLQNLITKSSQAYSTFRRLQGVEFLKCVQTQLTDSSDLSVVIQETISVAISKKHSETSLLGPRNEVSTPILLHSPLSKHSTSDILFRLPSSLSSTSIPANSHILNSIEEDLLSSDGTIVLIALRKLSEHFIVNDVSLPSLISNTRFLNSFMCLFEAATINNSTRILSSASMDIFEEFNNIQVGAFNTLLVMLDVIERKSQILLETDASFNIDIISTVSAHFLISIIETFKNSRWFVHTHHVFMRLLTLACRRNISNNDENASPPCYRRLTKVLSDDRPCVFHPSHWKTAAICRLWGVLCAHADVDERHNTMKYSSLTLEKLILSLTQTSNYHLGAMLTIVIELLNSLNIGTSEFNKYTYCDCVNLSIRIVVFIASDLSLKSRYSSLYSNAHNWISDKGKCFPDVFLCHKVATEISNGRELLNNLCQINNATIDCVLLALSLDAKSSSTIDDIVNSCCVAVIDVVGDDCDFINSFEWIALTLVMCLRASQSCARIASYKKLYELLVQYDVIAKIFVVPSCLLSFELWCCVTLYGRHDANADVRKYSIALFQQLVNIVSFVNMKPMIGRSLPHLQAASVTNDLASISKSPTNEYLQAYNYGISFINNNMILEMELRWLFHRSKTMRKNALQRLSMSTTSNFDINTIDPFYFSDNDDFGSEPYYRMSCYCSDATHSLDNTRMLIIGLLSSSLGAATQVSAAEQLCLLSSTLSSHRRIVLESKCLLRLLEQLCESDFSVPMRPAVVAFSRACVFLVRVIVEYEGVFKLIESQDMSASLNHFIKILSKFIYFSDVWIRLDVGILLAKILFGGSDGSGVCHADHQSQRQSLPPTINYITSDDHGQTVYDLSKINQSSQLCAQCSDGRRIGSPAVACECGLGARELLTPSYIIVEYSLIEMLGTKDISFKIVQCHSALCPKDLAGVAEAISILGCDRLHALAALLHSNMSFHFPSDYFSIILKKFKSSYGHRPFMISLLDVETAVVTEVKSYFSIFEDDSTHGYLQDILDILTSVLNVTPSCSSDLALLLMTLKFLHRYAFLRMRECAAGYDQVIVRICHAIQTCLRILLQLWTITNEKNDLKTALNIVGVSALDLVLLLLSQASCINDSVINDVMSILFTVKSNNDILQCDTLTNICVGCSGVYGGVASVRCLQIISIVVSVDAGASLLSSESSGLLPILLPALHESSLAKVNAVNSLKLASLCVLVEKSNESLLNLRLFSLAQFSHCNKANNDFTNLCYLVSRVAASTDADDFEDDMFEYLLQVAFDKEISFSSRTACVDAVLSLCRLGRWPLELRDDGDVTGHLAAIPHLISIHVHPLIRCSAIRLLLAMITEGKLADMVTLLFNKNDSWMSLSEAIRTSPIAYVEQREQAIVQLSNGGATNIEAVTSEWCTSNSSIIQKLRNVSASVIHSILLSTVDESRKTLKDVLTVSFFSIPVSLCRLSSEYIRDSENVGMLVLNDFLCLCPNGWNLILAHSNNEELVKTLIQSCLQAICMYISDYSDELQSRQSPVPQLVRRNCDSACHLLATILSHDDCPVLKSILDGVIGMGSIVCLKLVSLYVACHTSSAIHTSGYDIKLCLDTLRSLFLQSSSACDAAHSVHLFDFFCERLSDQVDLLSSKVGEKEGSGFEGDDPEMSLLLQNIKVTLSLLKDLMFGSVEIQQYAAMSLFFSCALTRLWCVLLKWVSDRRIVDGNDAYSVWPLIVEYLKTLLNFVSNYDICRSRLCFYEVDSNSVTKSQYSPLLKYLLDFVLLTNSGGVKGLSSVADSPCITMSLKLACTVLQHCVASDEVRVQLFRHKFFDSVRTIAPQLVKIARKSPKFSLLSRSKVNRMLLGAVSFEIVSDLLGIIAVTTSSVKGLNHITHPAKWLEFLLESLGQVSLKQLFPSAVVAVDAATSSVTSNFVEAAWRFRASCVLVIRNFTYVRDNKRFFLTDKQYIVSLSSCLYESCRMMVVKEERQFENGHDEHLLNRTKVRAYASSALWFLIYGCEKMKGIIKTLENGQLISLLNACYEACRWESEWLQSQCKTGMVDQNRQVIAFATVAEDNMRYISTLLRDY